MKGPAFFENLLPDGFAHLSLRLAAVLSLHTELLHVSQEGWKSKLNENGRMTYDRIIT